jgi:uncharacterized coiled-coil DUF342 family protein
MGFVDDRDDAIAAYREFTRELIVRFERTVRELVKESRAERELILAEIRTHREESRQHHREVMAQIEAQTQALFRVLDRLDGGAEPAT